VKIGELRTVYGADPFRPFVIHLNDGRRIPVHRREWIMSTPSGWIIVVCQPDDSCDFIDIDSVDKLELDRPRRQRNRRTG
jgi:hypothetical protein